MPRPAKVVKPPHKAFVEDAQGLTAATLETKGIGNKLLQQMKVMSCSKDKQMIQVFCL